jgi:hypothetical protein
LKERLFAARFVKKKSKKAFLVHRDGVVTKLLHCDGENLRREAHQESRHPDRIVQPPVSVSVQWDDTAKM